MRTMKISNRVGMLLLILAFGSAETAACVTAATAKAGIIWQGEEETVKLSDLAALAAPILWPSPDEPFVQRQQAYPRAPKFLEPRYGGGRMAFYQINKAETYEQKTRHLLKPILYTAVGKPAKPRYYYEQVHDGWYEEAHRDDQIRLNEVHLLYLLYLFYYGEEEGVGAHGNDLEAIQVILEIDGQDINTPKTVRIKEIRAHAHGASFFDNRLEVREYTKLPVHILIEEGKHASCTDQNGDGVYTPGYDVNKNPTDAWGLKDVIRSERVPASKFTAFMAKPRDPQHRICPAPQYVALYPEPTISAMRANYDHWCSTAMDTYTLVPSPGDWKRELDAWSPTDEERLEIERYLKEGKTVETHIEEARVKLGEKEFGIPGAKWGPSGIQTYPFNLRMTSSTTSLALKNIQFFKIPFPVIKYDGTFHLQYNVQIDEWPDRLATDLMLIYTPSIGRMFDWFAAAGVPLFVFKPDKKKYEVWKYDVDWDQVFPKAPVFVEGGVRIRLAPGTVAPWLKFTGFRLGLRTAIDGLRTDEPQFFLEFGLGSI